MLERTILIVLAVRLIFFVFGFLFFVKRVIGECKIACFSVSVSACGSRNLFLGLECVQLLEGFDFCGYSILLLDALI